MCSNCLGVSMSGPGVFHFVALFLAALQKAKSFTSQQMKNGKNLLSSYREPALCRGSSGSCEIRFSSPWSRNFEDKSLKYRVRATVFVCVFDSRSSVGVKGTQLRSNIHNIYSCSSGFFNFAFWPFFYGIVGACMPSRVMSLPHAANANSKSNLCPAVPIPHQAHVMGIHSLALRAIF